MKNCQIISVDVERSFSAYKNLLTSNRQSFKFENIKKSLIVQYNFQGKIIYKINSKNRYLKKIVFIFSEPLKENSEEN
jgi:hypothetical protein